MPKIPLEKRLERYEDFYQRAFQDVDVEKIFQEGGGTSFNKFKETTRGKTKDLGYYDAMFKRKVKGRISNKLGKEMYRRFFENEKVTLNKADRIITRKGEQFTFKGKSYKGGMFVPRSFFARRY